MFSPRSFIVRVLAPIALVSAAAAQTAPWAETALLETNVSNIGLYVGASADVDGDTAVLGSTPYGLLGSAYVFERGAGVWTEVAELGYPASWPDDGFGYAVAIHGDTVVVGAPRANVFPTGPTGVAYVYERNAGGVGNWGFVTTLTASDGAVGDVYGWSVAIHEDTVAIGAYADSGYVGDAYVYERNAGGAGAWGEVARLVASDGVPGTWFGTAVDVFGDTIVVGAEFHDLPTATNAGAAYLFERNAGGPDAWGETAQLTGVVPSSLDHFGVSVSIFADTVLVGAREALQAGAAYVFERNLGGANAWGQAAVLAPSDGVATDWFGNSVSLYGDLALVGAFWHDHPVPNGGAAYAYARDQGGAGAWGETAELTASDAANDDYFGRAVALSGPTALVGAPQRDTGYKVGSTPGLACDAATGALFASDSTDALLDVDRASGFADPIGALGSSTIGGLAHDANTGTLYGCDWLAGQLVVVDPNTGAATPIGLLGFSYVQGLAFDPVTSTLYGVDTGTAELLTIDAATGAATAVGPLGYPSVFGLAFDPSSATLYGVAQSVDQLITIDTTTGAGTPVGTIGLPGGPTVHGLTFDPVAGVLYGMQTQGILSRLVTIDTATGAGTPVGYLLHAFHGAGYVFELQPIAYCTAGVSSSGCQATLSAVGRASATPGSGFTVSASGVEGSKGGIPFFGGNGRQANPWGNGTSFQCVVPPVTRTGLLTGTGTPGQCDGSFSLDLNALWCPTCPKPAKNPGAGATVQAQLWYRDPFSTSNQTTSLSDAIEFTVAP
jgi:hypothetical protein